MPQPIKTFKAGPLSVAIFDNDGRLSAAPSKAYKDEQTGEWKYTNTGFGTLHAAALLELLRLAAAWMIEHESGGGSVRESGADRPRSRPFREARERSLREAETGSGGADIPF